MKNPLANAGIIWHDLPISRLSFVEAGISIEVTPYNEETKNYDRATLSILMPENISVDMQSIVSLRELALLEIADLQLSEGSDERWSGVVGILPGGPSVGYWELRFTNAKIELEWPNNSLQARRP